MTQPRLTVRTVNVRFFNYFFTWCIITNLHAVLYLVYFSYKGKTRLLLTVTMCSKRVFIMFISCFQIPLYYGNLLSPPQGQNNLHFSKFLFFAQKLEDKCPPKLWSENEVVLFLFLLIRIALEDPEGLVGWGCPGVRTTLFHRHDWFFFFNLKRFHRVIFLSIV